MQLLTNPLFIEDQPHHNSEGKRGSSLKRRVVVKNLGDRPAEIDLWIVATEAKSEPLLRWCSFSERNPFKLDAKESREVTLTFQIPPQATPDVYRYEVLVDAQAQYPDKPPVRRPQQLRVLPSDQDAEWGTDPSFSVKPITTAAQPCTLNAGQSFEVTVNVKNCSKRVDRFYLTCPELPPAWFTVRYPESSLEAPGLIQETDGLELNPGSSGEIVLTLHPPQHTPAGHYFPTLRLTSSNDESLVLLDVVYLQILVCDRLNLSLQPHLRRVPGEAGEFDLALVNQGNRERAVIVRVADPNDCFHYRIQPDRVTLAPGTLERLVVKASPKRGWSRPWWGRGRELQFDVMLEDLYTAPPLAASGAPTTGPITQGRILWQPRPWWVLALCLVTSLGIVGAIALLILQRTIFSPPLPIPQIASVGNSLNPKTGQAQIYQIDNDEMIRLDWQISRLRDIDRITIIHKQQGVEVNRKSYVFAGKIPAELRQRNSPSGFCEPGIVEETDGLHCRGVAVTPAQAGTHTFQIEVFSSRDRRTPADTLTTDSIAIAPPAVPKIIQFVPSATVYRAVATQGTGAIAPIRLNWEMSAPDQIQELQWMAIAADGSLARPVQRYVFRNGLPTGLQNRCRRSDRLICQNVPTGITQSGSYTFQLTLISRQASEMTRRTPRVRIQPPPPQIQSFQLDGQEIGQTTRFQFEINPSEPRTLAFSWRIQAAPNARIELLPVPGSVAAQGSINYPLSALPGQQTVTLRVTQPSGEQVTRSLLLETVAPPPPTPPASATPPTTLNQKPNTSPQPTPLPSPNAKPPSPSTK